MSKVNSILQPGRETTPISALPSSFTFIVASMYGVEYVSYYVEYIQLGILQRPCTLPSDPSTFLCFFCVFFFLPFSFLLPPLSPHSPSHTPHTPTGIYIHTFTTVGRKKKEGIIIIKKKKKKNKRKFKKKEKQKPIKNVIVIISMH